MAGESMQSLGLLDAGRPEIPDVQIDPSLTAETANDNYTTLYVYFSLILSHGLIGPLMSAQPSRRDG